MTLICGSLWTLGFGLLLGLWKDSEKQIFQGLGFQKLMKEEATPWTNWVFSGGLWVLAQGKVTTETDGAFHGLQYVLCVTRLWSWATRAFLAGAQVTMSFLSRDGIRKDGYSILSRAYVHWRHSMLSDLSLVNPASSASPTGTFNLVGVIMDHFNQACDVRTVQNQAPECDETLSLSYFSRGKTFPSVSKFEFVFSPLRHDYRDCHFYGLGCPRFGQN